MKKCYVLIVSLVAVLACSNGVSDFGTGFDKICLEGKCSQPVDINGDMVKDSLILLKATEKSRMASKCQSVNLWGESQDFESGVQIVLGFLMSQNGKAIFNPYIVHNRSFFSTPIWQTESPPVAIVSEEKVKTLAGELVRKNAVGQVISLGTEAGIDIFLYWDGKKFSLFEPDEDP